MVKTIAITGGAQGIGRAIALAYANKGYAVSIADLNIEAGEEVVQLIQANNGKGLFVCCDVSDKKQVEHWINQTVKTFACPDVLINNAAIGKNHDFLTLSIEDFNRVQQVNVNGYFLCSQILAKLMVVASKKGCIVNIASTRAFMSEPNTEAYSASKGAVIALTHAMAISLGKYDIRVNSISPGWIETSNWQYSKHSKPFVHSDEDKKQHPVGRVGTPEDIVEACFYLSESAGFVTGQNIIIDGGMSVKMIYE